MTASASPTLTLVVAADTAGITNLKKLLTELKQASQGLTGLMAAQSSETASALRAEELLVKKHKNILEVLEAKHQNDLTLQAKKGLTERSANLGKALTEDAIKTKLATSTMLDFNHAMREGHSLARGIAGPLNAMWLTWGSLVPLLAGAGISSALAGSIKAGAEFEMTLARIQGVSGETKESVKGMGEEFKRMAESSVFGSKEVASGALILTQAGLNIADAVKTLPTVLQLAAVGELDMAAAAEIATGTMNAFGLSVEHIPGVANVLSKAADISQTNIGEMGEAMKQASTVAKQYQISLVDMSAGIASLAQVNIRGSAAGTAYRNMLNNLASPTKKGAEELHKLGVSAFDAHGKIKDMPSTFTELSKALSKMNDAERAHAINSIFTERGAKGALNYMRALNDGTIEKFTKALREVAESVDYLKGKQDLLNNTVGAQAKMAFNSMQVAMIDAFTSSSTGLLDLTIKLKEFAQSAEFKEGLRSLVSGFVSLVNALRENKALIINALKIWIEYKVTVGLFIPVAFGVANGLKAIRLAWLELAALRATATMVGWSGALVGVRVGALALSSVAFPLLGVAIAAAGLAWYLFKDTADKAMDAVDGRVKQSAELLQRVSSASYVVTRSDGEDAVIAYTTALKEQQKAEAELRRFATLPQGFREDEASRKGKSAAEQDAYNYRLVKESITSTNKAKEAAKLITDKLNVSEAEAAKSAAELSKAIIDSEASLATSNYVAPKEEDKKAAAIRAAENAAENRAAQEQYNNELRYAKLIRDSRETVAKSYLDAHKITLEDYQRVSDLASEEYADSALNSEIKLIRDLKGTEQEGKAALDKINIDAKKKMFADNRAFEADERAAKRTSDRLDASLALEKLEAAGAGKLAKLDADAKDKQTKNQSKFDRRFDAPEDNSGVEARIAAEKTYQDEIEKTKQDFEAIQKMYGNNVAGAEADKTAQSYLKLINTLEKAKTAHGDVAEASAKANAKIAKTWQEGAMQAVYEYTSATENAAKRTHDITTKMFKGMEDTLVEFTKTGKLNFKSLAASIIEDLIRIQIQEQLTQAFSAGSKLLMGFLGSLAGAAGGGLTGANQSAGNFATVAANGQAFNGGSLTAFAGGGAFTNNVVSSPTTFPMGLMGEAGPEAIMPLSRDSSGRLGVKSSGGSSGGGTVINNVSVTVQGGKDPAETGDIVSAKVMATMKSVADGQIANSLRLGGMLNRASK